MGKVFVFMIFLCYINISYEIATEDILKQIKHAHILEPSKKLRCCSESILSREYPVIYCYKSAEKTLEHLWMTSEVLITMNPEQYELYWGDNETDVIEQFQSEQSILKFNLYFWKPKNVKFDPFNNTCFGILTSHDYVLELHVEKYNTLKQWLFIAGVTLFYVADHLAQNRLFFYLTGVTGGVLLSFGILAYFLLALMPAKRMTLAAMLAGGGGVMFFAMDWIVSGIRTILIKYQMVVSGYVAISAIVSFFICYRYGPVTNPQSINIIKWSIQGASAVAMWASSYYQEAVLVIIGLMVVLHYVPFFRISCRLVDLILRILIWFFTMMNNFSEKVGNYLIKWYLYFGRLVIRFWRYLWNIPPPTPPLLTIQEYQVQGQIETENAMQKMYDSYHNNHIDAFEALYHLSPEGREKILLFLTGRERHVTYEEQAEHFHNYDGMLTDDDE